MEFLIGSLATLMTVIIVQKSVQKTAKKLKPMKPKFTQSRSNEVLKLYRALVPSQREPLVTQSTRHFDDNSTKILFYNNMAYWIDNNKVYQANVIDGEIDSENKIVVDTMNMSDVELKKINFVVETLTKGGDNDRRNTGK